MNFLFLSLHIWVKPMLSGTDAPGAKLTAEITPSVYLKFRIHDTATDLTTLSRSQAAPTIAMWLEKDF